MTRWIHPMIAFAASDLVAVSALAHAVHDRAVPSVGATVAQAPAEVTLWFTEPLEPAFSGVAVTKAAGERVDTGTATIDPKDRQELHVPLKLLPSGDYKVSWHVVSVDTHPTQGTFTFDVGGK